MSNSNTYEQVSAEALRYRLDSMLRFPFDCQRIQRVAKERHGIDISIREADEIWRSYSDEKYAAGFIGIASDDHISEALHWYSLFGGQEPLPTRRDRNRGVLP